MDNAEWKSNMRDMQEGPYPKKKKKRVAGKFGVLLESLPQSSIDQKRIAGLKT